MEDTRQAAVIKAVEEAKASEFGVTAVKVELEIVFNRQRNDRGECSCSGCYGRGQFRCPCVGLMGDGIAMPDCSRCNGNGIILCRFCSCPEEIHQANRERVDWMDNKVVHDKILERLKAFGLARKLRSNDNYGLAYNYKNKKPLVYSKVYTDATVDTEYTFTLLLDKAENALLLPKIVEAFYSLKEEIGQETSVATAGMHMAFLNSAGGVYPSYATADQRSRYKNFRRSMILLMPALYFLGSCDERSRSLTYRRPKVGCQDHYSEDHTSAINYTCGALEFRLFETCYDKPEAILDNLVVMCNCLKYWSTTYTRNHLARITNKVPFGIEDGSDLKRFYVTTEHINLLNRGLKLIKPSYYSLRQLKTQRKFRIDLRNIRDEESKVRVEAEKEYQLYEKRFGWKLVTHRQRFIADFIHDRVNYRNDVPDVNDSQLLQEADTEADKYIKQEVEVDKIPVDRFCKDFYNRVKSVGEYELCVE